MSLTSRKLIRFELWTFIIFLSVSTSINGYFFNWFSIEKDKQSPETLNNYKEPLITIPFEYKTEDEKFLEEASKFTDLIRTSSLDVCQHKVILQIKTSCFSMNEEDLAKMSVNLLNCQSQVDEREIFPCTESMSLKECTQNMNANMWNAYHLMNNRARSVCLSARRAQFQALSEMTINKLMATAHDQIQKMGNLMESQEKLESLTLSTMDSVERSHHRLIEQQENLKSAQKKIQDFITINLEQLTTEKALIAAGNEELAKMTKGIAEKLDEASEHLNFQFKEQALSHQKLLQDIETLQRRANDIFDKIGSSTVKLLMQHNKASQSYKTTVTNLVKINDTVYHLMNAINFTIHEIEEKLHWIQSFLDGTEIHIERLVSITFHIVYLLVGMLFASFLNFSTTSRALLSIIVPLNLFVTYDRGPEMALNFSQMTIFLASGILVFAVVHFTYNFFFGKDSPTRVCIASNGSGPFQEYVLRALKEPALSFRYFRKFFYRLNQFFCLAFGWVKQNSYKSSECKSDENFISDSCIHDRNENFDFLRERFLLREKYQESAQSKVNEWLRSKVDYAQSGSPSSTGSGSPKFFCSAVCRSGRRCKNTAHLGRDVCHKHLSGSSILE